MAKKLGGNFTFEETQIFFDIFDETIDTTTFHKTLTPQHIGLLYTLLARLNTKEPNKKGIVALKAQIVLLLDKLHATITCTKDMQRVWHSVHINITSKTLRYDNNVRFWRHIRKQSRISKLSTTQTEHSLKTLRRVTSAPALLRAINIMLKVLENPSKAIAAYLKTTRNKPIVRARSWPSGVSPRPSSTKL